MAYSIDFRRCVIENIESGKSWAEVAKIFSISQHTLYRWVKMSRKKGTLEDSERAAYKVRKIDSKELFSMLEKNPDATLKELAATFKCWPSAVERRLNKLGVTRKKNHSIRRKE